MHRILATVTIAFLLIGVITSCAQHYPTQPTKCDTCSDTTHYPCDTCNLNQDSLQRVKDSLSHAWVWTEYSIPGESNLTGCWVFGPNNVLIVGNDLWKYDGTRFGKLDPWDITYDVTMRGALNGYNIFAFDSADYWLISYGGDALHCFDGRNFEDFRPGATNAAWGPSSDDIFIVGNGGKIHHFDGTKFTDMASPTIFDLYSVWGTAHDDVWACGANLSTGKTTILHYDGATWTEDPLAQTTSAKRSGLSAVWACDSLGHRIIITSGSNVYHRTDNGIWRNDTTLVPNSLGQGSFVGLYLLSGNSSTDLFATGSWGWVGHWNGNTWKKFDDLYHYEILDYTSNALSANGNTICIVGVKSGNSWVAIGRRGR